MVPIDSQKATFVFSLWRVELILKGLMVHLTSPKHCALELSLHHWLGLVFLLPKWPINNNKMLIMCEWPTPVGMHVSSSPGLLWMPAVTNQDPETRAFDCHRVCFLAHSPPLHSLCHKNLDSLHKVHFSCYCSANHILSNNFRMWQDKIANINAISPHLKLWKRVGGGGGWGGGEIEINL